MHEESLRKVLDNNASLQETWSPEKHVADEMAITPPRYTFDIRNFAERPFQFRENLLQQYSSRMKVAEISMPQGLHVMHAELDSTSDGYICIDSAVPYIQFFFALNSDRHYYVDGKSIGKLAPGQVQAFLFCATEVVGIWHRRPEDRFVEVNISLTAFEAYLPQHDPLRPTLRNMLDRGQSGALLTQPLLISVQQKQILQDMVGKVVADELMELFCSAKLMELLARTLDQYRLQVIPPAYTADLSGEMKNRMAQAKRILEIRMSDPPSLAELAAVLGTNENYLKKYFKMYYQTTIYGYLTKFRMQKARDLLQKGEKPINEISRFLGYNNPAHFSASFKKHFGVMPKLIHRSAKGQRVG